MRGLKSIDNLIYSKILNEIEHGFFFFIEEKKKNVKIILLLANKI